MIHYIAQTSFMSWWERLCARWTAKYIIKGFGDGDFRVYVSWDDLVVSAHPTLESACDWCEKQINDSKVKSVTYVMED